MAEINKVVLDTTKEDLDLTNKFSEMGLTAQEIADSIKKVHSINSSASEIDGSVNLTIIPEGLNQTDDMTSIIQTVIDILNEEYLSSNERLPLLKTITIPEGKYKIENLHLKSGIRFNTIGVLEPLSINSNSVFLSGSYIEIDNLNISSRNINNYSGRLLSLDTSDVNTLDFLKTKSKLKKPAFINIQKINLQNNEAIEENNAIYFKSVSLNTGISWININGNISNSYHGIDYIVENDGYINSTRFKGFTTNCIEPISIYTGSGTGESAQNEFDIHIQPRANNLSRGVYNEGSLNTFTGAIWDWSVDYRLAVNDLGGKNFYGNNFVSPHFFQTHVRISNITTKFNGYYESLNSFNLNYHISEEDRNISGFQDNLLAYANRRYTVTVSPTNPPTLYKAFTQPQAINWAVNTTWPSSNGEGEIVYTITNIASCRISSIVIGFQKLSRVCSGIKVECKSGEGAWMVLDTVTDNKSTRYMYRANGGSGHDLDALRFTFTGGIDASNPKVLVNPNSNILAIQSISAFGAGERLSFVSPYDSKFINLSAASSSSILNNSLFIDIVDKFLKYKNDDGVIEFLQNLKNSITPEMFGAKGDGVTNDSAAILLAVSQTSQKVKLVGSGTYACNNIVLPRETNIDLTLVNYNLTDPVLLINGQDINLNNTTINTSAQYTGKTICLDDTMPYFTATNIARLRADDLQVTGWQSGTIYGATAFYIKLTKIGASFWVIERFRSMACKKGFIVETSESGYWTSNKINHCQVFQFKTDPILFSSSTGAEISANYIYMEIQPTSITLDGVKILGGRTTKRNIFDGEIWDWHYAPIGTKALEDFGWNTQLRHTSSRNINTNPTTNIKTIGHSTIPTMDLNIPSNAQGKCISGHADNYLAYANLRSQFLINQPNGNVNAGTLDTLFSLDSYTSVGWTGLSQDDIRIIEIIFNEVIHGDMCLISFDIAGIPRNVKIEFLNTATSNWDIKLDISNNMSTTVGRRGSDTAFDTGLSTCGGVRFTMSAPRKYNDTTYMKDIIDDTRIRITNIYFASNKNKIKSPYVDTSIPILLGDLRSSKTVEQSISEMTQTKCLKVMNESGSLIGYIPIYQ